MQKTRPPEESPGLRMFCLMYACYGVGIRNAAPKEEGVFEYKLSRKRCLLIRVAALLSFLLYVAGSTVALADYSTDKVSLLDFVRISYNITAYTTMLLGLTLLSRNENELSRILFHSDFFVNKFHMLYFRRALIYNTPSITIDFFLALDSLVKGKAVIVIIGYVCGIYVWQIQLATYCMYMQCQAVIRGQLQQLAHMVRVSSFNEESIRQIARAKQCIRLSIEKMNGIFGNFLLLYYVKMFALLTLRIGAIILWGTEQYLSVFLNSVFGVSFCFQIAQMYGTTTLGSEIIYESQKLERYLFQPRKAWDDVRQKALTEIRRVLRYHGHFDALLISDSFVNQRATTFTFLGTMFTCVAIILQFDCDILKILELARSDLD